jgi:hypothetical protein
MPRSKRKPVRALVAVETKSPTAKKPGQPPGRTVESVENQLIGLATDLAMKQIKEGTASSQVLTHFLKLGSTLNKLEAEKLRQENELLAAKTEALKGQKKIEDLYLNALDAMRTYTGNTKAIEAGQIVDEDSDD